MENREFDKLDRLIREKSYDSLTSEERIFVDGQIDGEKAYNDLWSLILQTQQTDSIPVTPSVKIDLVNQFKNKYQRTPLFWLNYKMPAYANVLLIAIAVLAVWYLKPAEQVVVDRLVTIQIPGKIDTLMIQLPADTVFIEKRIRVEVPVYVTKIEVPEPAQLHASIKGNSLSNQQGLRDLLVTGR